MWYDNLQRLQFKSKHVTKEDLEPLTDSKVFAAAVKVAKRAHGER